MLSGQYGLAKAQEVSTPKQLASAYGEWEGIRTNHVLSNEGSFYDDAASSRGLTNPHDFSLLLALRERADLVVVDAATARKELYRSIKSAKLAIVSQSGDFAGIPAAETNSQDVFLFSQKVLSPIVRPVLRDNPFPELVEFAKRQGLNKILLESGPNLTALAFEVGLVKQSAISYNFKDLPLSPDTVVNPFDTRAQLLSLSNDDLCSYALWAHDGVAA